MRQGNVKEPRRAARRAAVEVGSLSVRAYQQIRDEILRGHLKVGDNLSRRRLADRLNMSFLPITEALRRLESEGLVESRPRIGTRVRVPTEQDIRDNYIIREALESQAARLCAQNMTAADKEDLLMRATRLDELNRICMQGPDDSDFLTSVHNYHLQFHMRIAELAASPGLRAAIEKAQVLIFNWLYDMATNHYRRPENFHSSLASALCSGDSIAADEAIRIHIRYGMEEVLKRIAVNPHRTHWR